MNKPLILISNDDSINAKGIKVLVKIAEKFGRVVVVAPDKPQSAKSHSITLEAPLTFTKSNIFGENIESYYCSGTPADCIKLAYNNILDKKPDLILSGINHGSNFSVNLIYSGTVAVAIEGTMHNTPSIAFSVTSHDPDADFSSAEIYVEKIIRKVLESNLDELCLNVNIPDVKPEEIKGIRTCKQTKGAWFEEFVKIPHPDSNKDYYWLTGKYVNFEPESTDTDAWAINNNYVSIVPLKIDFTDYKTLEQINFWKF